jgi:hypothetical protein
MSDQFDSNNAFDTTPDTDSRPIIEDGQYGLNGEATLMSVEGRVHITGPQGKHPGNKTPWIRFSTGIQTEGQGMVFVDSSPWTKPHTKWAEKSGSKATTFLKALGLFPPTFGPPDEAGNRSVLGAEGMKVIVTVGHKEDERDGTVRNHIVAIERRP